MLAGVGAQAGTRHGHARANRADALTAAETIEFNFGKRGVFNNQTRALPPSFSDEKIEFNRFRWRQVHRVK
jgi:hypothetical protein